MLNWVVDCAVDDAHEGHPVTGPARPIRRDAGECTLTFDNIRVVGKAYLTRRITTLPAHRWQEVCEALTLHLAC